MEFTNESFQAKAVYGNINEYKQAVEHHLIYQLGLPTKNALEIVNGRDWQRDYDSGLMPDEVINNLIKFCALVIHQLG